MKAFNKVFRNTRAPKYQVESYALPTAVDELIWYEYELSASGNSFEDLVLSATIREVDEDGNELDCYGLLEAAMVVRTEAYKQLANVVDREMKLTKEAGDYDKAN